MELAKHKRILGIFHLIYGSLLFFLLIFIRIGFSFVSAFIMNESGDGLSMPGPEMLEFIWNIADLLFVLVFLLVLLPSFIGGFGLLNQKKWSMPVVMISGCLSLLSFPIGTALGAYTIWVFVENNQHQNV